jgi:hypothetical protein
MSFVNKIFIPLIKVEKTLPMTLQQARGIVKQEKVEEQEEEEDDQIMEIKQIE